MNGDEKVIRMLLEHAERNAKILHRSNGCRTFDGTVCIPTMAVDLAGGIWAGEPGGELSAWVHAEPADDPDEVLHLVHGHDRASRLLKVDLAMDDDLTLADLRSLIER